MINARITEKMIQFYEGSLHDINHFLKVQAFAVTIGKLEGLDTKTLSVLEKAAIVHDIACPLCRAKYGNCAGHYQEKESKALLRPFLAEFDLPEDELTRIIRLVSRHHTFTDIDGIDCQILIEADFIVNAGEQGLSPEAVTDFRDKVFRTAAGKRLLAGIFS